MVEFLSSAVNHSPNPGTPRRFVAAGSSYQNADQLAGHRREVAFAIGIGRPDDVPPPGAVRWIDQWSDLELASVYGTDWACLAALANSVDSRAGQLSHLSGSVDLQRGNCDP